MTAHLATSVVVVDPESGNTRILEAGTEATKDLREQIPNQAAWTDGDETSDVSETDADSKSTSDKPRSGGRRSS